MIGPESPVLPDELMGGVEEESEQAKASLENGNPKSELGNGEYDDEDLGNHDNSYQSEPEEYPSEDDESIGSQSSSLSAARIKEIEETRLSGFYKVTALAYSLASEIAELKPEIIDAAAQAAYTVLLGTAARSLSFFVRQDMERHHPEEIPVTENPCFRPYSRVIEEGIENFRENHPDIPVVWRRNEDSLTKVSQYFRYFRAVGRDKEALASYDFPRRDPLEVVLASLQSGKNFQETESLVVKYLPEQYAEMIGRSMETDQVNLSAKYEYDTQSVLFGGLREKIEQVYLYQDEESTLLRERLEPVSAARVLEIVLEQTNGDLAAAFYSMAGFFKYMARGTREFDWLQKCIADEYSSLVPYQSLDDMERPYSGEATKLMSKIAEKLVWDAEKPNEDINYDFSLANQVGKPYHAANIVAFLEFFPPEMIAVMVAGEYLKYGAKHGANKALADVMVLLELRKIEKLLKKYETKGSGSPSGGEVRRTG